MLGCRFNRKKALVLGQYSVGSIIRFKYERVIMKKQLTILIASGALALAFVAASVQLSGDGISASSALAQAQGTGGSTGQGGSGGTIGTGGGGKGDRGSGGRK